MTLDPQIERLADEIRELHQRLDEVYFSERPNQALDTTSSPTFGSVLLSTIGRVKAYTGSLADAGAGSVLLTGENGIFAIREHSGNNTQVVLAAFGGAPVSMSGAGFLTLSNSGSNNWKFYFDATAYRLVNNTTGAGSKTYTVLVLSFV